MFLSTKLKFLLKCYLQLYSLHIVYLWKLFDNWSMESHEYLLCFNIKLWTTNWVLVAQLDARFLPRSTIWNKPRHLLCFVCSIVDALGRSPDILLIWHPLLIRGHNGRVCPVGGRPVNGGGLLDGAWTEGEYRGVCPVSWVWPVWWGHSNMYSIHTWWGGRDTVSVFVSISWSFMFLLSN